MTNTVYGSYVRKLRVYALLVPYLRIKIFYACVLPETHVSNLRDNMCVIKCVDSRV